MKEKVVRLVVVCQQEQVEEVVETVQPSDEEEPLERVELHDEKMVVELVRREPVVEPQSELEEQGPEEKEPEGLQDEV